MIDDIESSIEQAILKRPEIKPLEPEQDNACEGKSKKLRLAYIRYLAAFSASTAMFLQ